MAYCFQLRCNLANSTTVHLDPPRHVLAAAAETGHDVELVLNAHTADAVRSRSLAHEVMISGRPYDSEAAAADAGRRWRGWAEIAFARLRIGANFGDGGVLDGSPSLWVYDDTNANSLGRTGDATAVRTEKPETVARAICEAAARDLIVSDQQRIAHNIFSTSFTAVGPEAKLVTLMTAFEVLLTREERSDEALAVVDQLAEAVKKCELDADEKQSLLGSVKELRYKSVGQLGRRLAATIGDRTYMDDQAERPDSFFQKTYRVRSNLVHGNLPRPDEQVVRHRGQVLEEFMSDVLAGDLRDFNPRL